MEWIILLLILSAVYLLALAGYRLLLASKDLKLQLGEVLAKLAAFSPAEPEITAAQPVFAEDLPRLLRQRRAMEKRKAREREERKRRLVARISSINIDRR